MLKKAIRQTMKRARATPPQQGVDPANGEEELASQRKKKAYHKGAIYRMEFCNFMSYRHMEMIDPGSKLNCIIGPNGSGKSSIVCGMCIGLGGSLSVTERGDKISACVHGNGSARDENGSLITSGSVEIELWEGSGPGKNLTVRVDFNMENKEHWRMNGASSSKKAVKETLKGLRIAVDNPLQFLPQDKVGQFSTLAPEKLLEYTEEAIGEGLMDQHRELIQKQGELKKMRHALATEEKTLADLEAENEGLQKDVDRWNRYQRGLARMELLGAKKLWLAHETAAAELEEVHADYRKKKDELAAKNREKAEREQKLRPLKETLQRCKDTKAKADIKYNRLDAEKTALGGDEGGIDQAESDIQKARLALLRVDQDYRKRLDNLETLKANLADAQSSLSESERAAETQLGTSPTEALAVAQQDVESARLALNAAGNDCDDHDSAARQLERELCNAEQGVRALGDVSRRKQQLIARDAPDSARLAHWAHGAGLDPKNDFLGPILMHFDIPNALHAQLAEQAITKKNASSFFARNNQARDKLNQHCKEHNLRVNIYKFDGRFAPPPNRPSAAELSHLGVEAWLDEALTVADDARNQVLGSLSQLMRIESFLLCNNKAVANIEELQQLLARKGCTTVKILTPALTFSTSQSRYGNKALISTSSVPRRAEGTFSNSVDPALQQQREAALTHAKEQLSAHQETSAELRRAVETKKSAHAAATERLKAVQSHITRLKHLQNRKDQLQLKISAAEKEVGAFDSDAKKEEHRARLREAHNRLCEFQKQLSAIIKKQAAAVAEVCGHALEAEAVETILIEAKHELQDVEAVIRQLQTSEKDAQGNLQVVKQRCLKLKAEAEAKAPQLSSERRAGDEKAAKEWSSMPSSLDEIDDEIEMLEAETSADRAGADANSLKHFKEKMKQLEEVRERVAESTSSLEAESSAVRSLENNWKPRLLEMVETVNANFSKYFQRFKCVGEVALSDGKRRNADGNVLSDEDDYSQYKIHIMVKWRANEQLHVLGEAGRDSGGERSVATMIYLIALQIINPAPFRVVDEINQAMDSTNERNVFACIMEACKDGGKQYFLLTPKLLPDLDYGTDTTIQLVCNGPYMLQRKDMDLAAFC